MKRKLSFIVVFCVVGSNPVAGNPADCDPLPGAAQNLLNQYTGLQVHCSAGTVRSFYGKPMTSGATPDDAAAQWLASHVAAFGITGFDLQLQRRSDIDFGKFTIFVYEQEIGGATVEGGSLRILVLNGSPNRVVYAVARLARVPSGGFAPDTVDASTALQGVQQDPGYAQLDDWGTPEMVVFVADEDIGAGTAVRAWGFFGRKADPSTAEAYTFFVNAADGNLVYVRNEIYNLADIHGNVVGRATPGTRPDVSDNQPLPITQAPPFPACA